MVEVDSCRNYVDKDKLRRSCTGNSQPNPHTHTHTEYGTDISQYNNCTLHHCCYCYEGPREISRLIEGCVRLCPHFCPYYSPMGSVLWIADWNIRHGKANFEASSSWWQPIINRLEGNPGHSIEVDRVCFFRGKGANRSMADSKQQTAMTVTVMTGRLNSQFEWCNGSYFHGWLIDWWLMIDFLLSIANLIAS